MTLHALRTTIGDRAFFRVLRTWARGDGNGSTEEFVALAEQVSGRDLGSLFDAWLFTSGRPDVAAPSRPGARAGNAVVPAAARSLLTRLALEGRVR